MNSMHSHKKGSLDYKTLFFVQKHIKIACIFGYYTNRKSISVGV